MRVVILSLVMLTFVGCGNESPPERNPASPVNVVEMLDSATVNPIRLQGELSDMFALGSKYTDLQRENMKQKLIGTVVQWDLPVYEVSLAKGIYKVTTQGTNMLVAGVFITARNDVDRALLNSLKTDDVVSFKGKVSDILLRSVVIVDPAILVPSTRNH